MFKLQFMLKGCLGLSIHPLGEAGPSSKLPYGLLSSSSFHIVSAIEGEEYYAVCINCYTVRDRS
jgi:hypothetical protein